jgi:hypothetical protein
MRKGNGGRGGEPTTSGESSGSSLLEVQATLLGCHGGRESVIHLLIAKN